MSFLELFNSSIVNFCNELSHSNSFSLEVFLKLAELNLFEFGHKNSGLLGTKTILLLSPGLLSLGDLLVDVKNWSNIWLINNIWKHHMTQYQLVYICDEKKWKRISDKLPFIRVPAFLSGSAAYPTVLSSLHKHRSLMEGLTYQIMCFNQKCSLKVKSNNKTEDSHLKPNLKLLVFNMLHNERLSHNKSWKLWPAKLSRQFFSGKSWIWLFFFFNSRSPDLFKLMLLVLYFYPFLYRKDVFRTLIKLLELCAF